MQSLAEELLLANERFYDAFTSLDLKKCSVSGTLPLT